MDELVHHCLRELSFDGDLGCNVSRLRDFVVGFYSHAVAHPQVVDDPFCAFVWSIVVEQPTVRVGTVPAGISSEVYIAPQTSAKRKAAAKGEVHVEEAPPSLTLVENAREKSLEDLKAEYGEDIRIAVDPETSFAAITGSHIRSPKLSPMVYSALQLITRGREEGITTVELGRKTKYDQKTCFYVIKQLLELGLIIKARRGGVGNHSCIHKYFVERSAFWQQIQEEETKDDEPIIIGESRLQDGTPIEDETPAAESLKIDFEPVDSRHMSSLQLIKNRIVKLLKASQNNIHSSNNLIVTIGFANPTKTDRRFFQTRLRELIAQGVIERVMVPSSKVKSRYVKCIRLVSPDNKLPEGGVVLAPHEGEEDEKDIAFDDASVGHTEVKANRTIQKQVSDVLEEAGSVGRTLYEICQALGDFDKRTIELLLTRASKTRPPAHLTDLGIADFMESFGRERRHRYYTLAAYKTVMASENLDDTATSGTDIDLSKVGDFAIFNEAMFYDDDDKLHHYEDAFKDKEGAKPKKGAKKRKRGETEYPGDEEDVPEAAPKAKRGRPRKKHRVEDNDAPSPPKKQGKQPRVEGNDDALTPTKRSRPLEQPRVEEGGDGTATTSAVPTSGVKANMNISHLRRENEILRVIQDLGGIANLLTKDFFDAHIALLNDLAQRGEPASAPSGTRLDKRTADATVKKMESRGQIKILKTAIFPATGSTRLACLLYLPDTPQEKINAFLHHLSHSTPVPNAPKIMAFEEPVDFGASRGGLQRGIRKEKPEKDDPKHGTDVAHPKDADEKARKTRARQKRARQNRDEVKQPAKQNEIESAVQEAQLASDKVLAKPQAFPHPRPTAPPRVVANISEKSVHSLIAQQGPPLPALQSGRSRGKVKPKGEEDQSQSQAPQQRRSRFHWTREYDELARDASAVVRARCCNGVKMDLSAFDKVFPAVPRSSVRLRLAHLRENTGEDVYMTRLEERWYDLWVQYRGTEHLPDEDPQSPSNFDIVNHIEFLRKHVDKNALRVGYVEYTTRTKLPASTDDIIHHFDVLCNTSVSPAWDFMWHASVEEGREKQFLRQSFTHGADEVPYVTNPSDDVVQVAEAAVKMVFGMPAEHYDADLAATMLHHIGDQPVSIATSNLLRRGVLSKVVRDPKKMKPGRMLKISDVNLNAIGGSIHRDLFQDAVALDEVFAEQVDSMEWPLLASDGDIAALLQLVSEEQVDFTIDVAQLRNSRRRLDWNSKKADDNDIETNIQVRLNTLEGDDNEAGGSAILPSDESHSNPIPMNIQDESMEHGKTVSGTDAACIMKTQSRIVDCVSCIESTFSEFTAHLDCEQRTLTRDIFDRARASLESGASKSHYLTLGADNVVMDLLQRMSQTSPPLVLWVGYSAPVIVSSLYARAWTVEIVKEPNLTTLVLPRRWLDIHGGTIRGTWDAAVHAVMGVIVLHPGISQTELRWRLRAVFDRQELVDILSFLYREEAIRARGERLNGTIWPATLDDGEEQQVLWFIGKSRHWYQV